MDNEPPSAASADCVSPAAVGDDDYDNADDATEIVSNVTNHLEGTTARQEKEGTSTPAHGLFMKLRKFFNPRATDIDQLLNKLQTQFQLLDVEHRKYVLSRTRSRWDDPNHNNTTTTQIVDEKNMKEDPKHPLNNPKLISEVHFVGRKAQDPSIIELSSLLMNHDKFGSITELWLNQNLISDDGASAIALYLQSPTCALVELWLGDNNIGPVGTALISASLGSNTKLKCLGLYKNPIGNGGAMTLAQMLRQNHRLTTVDVHGCGRRGNNSEVLEGYGCKVVKARDGTEYVARVVAPLTEEEEGLVTDQRLLDAIQTYSAFNRINPTRKQVIRGFTDSKKPRSQDNVGVEEEGGDDRHHQTIVSKFLAELGSQPVNETLSDAEKQTWKDCEWDRLYVEIERARAAKKSLLNILEIKNDSAKETEGLLAPNDVELKETYDSRRDLDDEVVYTDARSWSSVKTGITGSRSRVLSGEIDDDDTPISGESKNEDSKLIRTKK